jgi:hypothetical protein
MLIMNSSVRVGSRAWSSLGFGLRSKPFWSQHASILVGFTLVLPESQKFSFVVIGVCEDLIVHQLATHHASIVANAHAVRPEKLLILR